MNVHFHVCCREGHSNTFLHLPGPSDDHRGKQKSRPQAPSNLLVYLHLSYSLDCECLSSFPTYDPWALGNPVLSHPTAANRCGIVHREVDPASRHLFSSGIMPPPWPLPLQEPWTWGKENMEKHLFIFAQFVSMFLCVMRSSSTCPTSKAQNMISLCYSMLLSAAPSIFLLFPSWADSELGLPAAKAAICCVP